MVQVEVANEHGREDRERRKERGGYEEEQDKAKRALGDGQHVGNGVEKINNDVESRMAVGAGCSPSL